MGQKILRESDLIRLSRGQDFAVWKIYQEVITESIATINDGSLLSLRSSMPESRSI